MSEALAHGTETMGMDELDDLNTQDLGSTGHSRLAKVAHLPQGGGKKPLPFCRSSKDLT